MISNGQPHRALPAAHRLALHGGGARAPSIAPRAGYSRGTCWCLAWLGVAPDLPEHESETNRDS
jgi:hypothetical protein